SDPHSVVLARGGAVVGGWHQRAAVRQRATARRPGAVHTLHRRSDPQRIANLNVSHTALPHRTQSPQRIFKSLLCDLRGLCGWNCLEPQSLRSFSIVTIVHDTLSFSNLQRPEGAADPYPFDGGLRREHAG